MVVHTCSRRISSTNALLVLPTDINYAGEEAYRYLVILWNGTCSHRAEKMARRPMPGTTFYLPSAHWRSLIDLL